jgi:hypothetical protein
MDFIALTHNITGRQTFVNMSITKRAIRITVLELNMTAFGI